MTLGKVALVEAARSQSLRPGLPGCGRSQALLMGLERVTPSWPASEVRVTVSGQQLLWPLGLDPRGPYVGQGPGAPHP